ncbi:DUF58 domain-containing protein [Rapidithrix thailandica]|uniref:DUF58 domain-containing protein n=1 Tax=Rapidithrix thailandica TaxID=413964 RepID=A0AAW9S3D5_9BACT
MKFIKSFYLHKRLFIALGINIFLFILGFSFSLWFTVAKVYFISLAALFLTDILLLYRLPNGVEAQRISPQKLSNGDENPIYIEVFNAYKFPVQVQIIDELPYQFQIRDMEINGRLASGTSQTYQYSLRPVKRGEYLFGSINTFVSSPLRLAVRRYQLKQETTLPVYPSFLQMRQYELLAISNRLSELGIKKIRRIGHNMEFEQIKEYVEGDDYRSINWPATARKHAFMVNQFQDERSQQVYALIDKGRVMKMPFEGMTLLDYAINASLVISNVAIRKQDKAGLITFNKKVKTVLPASNRNSQMKQILQTLYKEKTAFKESNFEHLYVQVKRQISQRSLLLLFSNFETLSGMERQLKYLKSLSKSHLLVVIFFKNTELHEVIHSYPKTTEELYLKTIAEKLAFEKRQIVKELQRHGIQSILTAPEELTVNTLNKYLELKARGLI